MQVIKQSTKRPPEKIGTALSVGSDRNAVKTDAVEDFKALVVQRNPGDLYVYHTGHLAADIASSPSLAHIQAMARGLQLMGRVELSQKRIKLPSVNTETGEQFWVYKTEYGMRLLPRQRVNSKDFDTARKAHLEDIKF